MSVEVKAAADTTAASEKPPRMSVRRLTLLMLAGGAMLALAFVLGLATQRYQFFPYPQIVGLVRIMKGHPAVDDVTRDGAINQQYIRDRQRVSVERNVDSVLLPLRLEGLRVSEEHAFPKGAGSITTLGNNVLILDRLGNVYAFRTGGKSVEKLNFPSLPNHINEYLASASYDGLNDRKFRAHHVLFLPSRNALAVSHSYFDTNIDWTRLAISVIAVDPATLQPTGDWKTVFLSDREPAGAYEGSGGAMLAREDGKIYLTLGDRPVEGGAAAELVEVDIDDGSSRIVCIGERNATGMAALDDGRVVAVDQGPYGGDELNVIGEGLNYGWPNVSLGTAYGAYELNGGSPAGSHGDYSQPIFAWLPSVGVSGILQVQNFDDHWKGDVLVSSLKGLSLYRLRFNGAFVQYSEQIFIGQRIRDFDELADGTIAMWTDDAQLLFLTVDNQKLAKGVRVAGYDQASIGSQCMYCHHFGPTSPADFAPSLSGLVGRKIASDNFPYSAGLRSVEGVWSEESLRAFLMNPGEFAPGTSMPNRFLSESDLDDIVEALAETRDTPNP